MVTFVIFETWQEQTHFRFGHAAGLVLLVGFGFSVVSYHFFDLFITAFSEAALFEYAIPFIVLNDGFNMRRQRFFKELASICLQGILTSFLSMSITIVCIYYLLKIELFRTSYHY